ncbi:serine--tRNA ligase [Candidatus Curtissbacteria bacterium RIFCSPLOWO2_01_FULL_41_18]|uniref:Serine--tRNA ligase n=1 Tax=Candidatus Curtissbacteria bacterium RIFCSPLOWO2_01_FULL_41_18 TaxID=1797727 RepID=A0A1F5HKC7_9BACT|nr:MAG: serine--tRNA ligase [Candidatus Curtissbacteria bacterium RIFCSPLOWO2_01_FULL_41_18]
MLDIKFIRQNPKLVREKSKQKGYDVDVEKLIKVDEERRKLIEEVDQIRSKRKKIAEQRDEKKGQELKKELKDKEDKLEKLQEEFYFLIREVPNMPLDDVPIGKDESDNKSIKKWGKPKKYDFKVKDYHDLGEDLKIIDTQTASKVAGSRFGYIKGELVQLEFALNQFALDLLTNEEEIRRIASGYNAKPFIPVIPPVMVKPQVLDQMARLEPKEERYYLEKDNLYLIGSAEHALGPIHINETLDEKDFPIRYVGFSASFRREAGSYGKDTRGIFRVHQFDKLEIESFTLPQDSVKEQDFIVKIQEYLMQALGIPYQIVLICTGDMGAPDARQIDIEAWFPAQGKYRETHTADLMTDYQARRLNTKVKRKNGASEFVHMNDATVFAQRTLLAIMENYQQKDGSILVPKALQKYTNFTKIPA